MKPFITNKGAKEGSSIMIRTEDSVETKPKEVANLMNNFYVNIATETGGNVSLDQGILTNKDHNYLRTRPISKITPALRELAGIPVEGKSSECLICMKYRIIILIIIIISLGQILYRILQTHHACTHASAHTRTRAHTCIHTAFAAVTVRRTGYRYSVSPNRDGPLRL